MKALARLHPAAAAILFMSICLVPLMTLRDISPANELKYLSIVDEALSQGHIFTFSNHGEPYADKPPLYFWLMMLSKLVFGRHDFLALSMLSFIPAMVTIAVMDRWLMLVSREASMKIPYGNRLAAAFMLGTSAMFIGTSIVLRMDMLMTMFIVLSMFTFYKMYRNTGNTALNGLLLPVYIFLALFSKGPVGLLVPVSAILVFLLFSGRIREAGRYLGFRTWGILFLLCCLWFAGVWLEGGTAYLENLLFHQTFGRAVDAFHHKEPVWYYLVAIWYVAAPFSLFYLYKLFSRPDNGYVTDAGRLFLTVFCVTFVMLSIFSSKLSVYLLPVLPFMAYFPAISSDGHGNAWVRFSLAIPSVILALASLAVLAFVIISPDTVQTGIPDDVAAAMKSVNVCVAASALLVGAVASFICLFRRSSWSGSAVCISVSLLAAVLLLTPSVPQINGRIGYRDLCAVARTLHDVSGVSGYTAMDIRNPESMDVFLGQDVRSFDDDITEFCLSDISDTILMIRTSTLRKYRALEDRLSGLHGVEVGGITVFIIK